MSIGLLLVLTLYQLARQIAAGSDLAIIVLASLTGFLVTGVTVSTFDQPRLALAFYLLCFAALCNGQLGNKREPDAQALAPFSRVDLWMRVRSLVGSHVV